MLLKISQNSQEDTCVGVSFLIKLEVSGNFVKKEALTQVFFCEFCEVFKNIYRTYAEHFFYRTYAVAASEKGVSYEWNFEYDIIMELWHDALFNFPKIFGVVYKSHSLF